MRARLLQGFRSTRSAHVAPSRALVVALTGAAIVACSSPSVGSAAPDAGPLSCDAGLPSYKSDIVPILDQSCIPCHSASGGTGYPEDTYAEVSNLAPDMLAVVVQGTMPPSNAAPLPAAARAALTDWLECRAPNN